MARQSGDEKSAHGVATDKKDLEQAECYQVDSVAKPNDGSPQELDKFGGYKKSDPKEIALVRKLDLWMMVSLLPRSSSQSNNKIREFCASGVIFSFGPGHNLLIN